MNNSTPGDVTLLLREWRNGNPEALAALYQRYFPELRAQAVSYLRQLPPIPQVQPTQIVNDVFVKMLEKEELSLENRLHFKAWAVTATWNVMVSYLRHEYTIKKGGGKTFVPLDEAEECTPAPAPEWFALREAIEHLTAIDEVKGRIAVLRYFGDFTISEIAEVLHLTTEQVKSRWNAAKAWLKVELTEGHLYGH